jgi:hypothetical protein
MAPPARRTHAKKTYLPAVGDKSKRDRFPDCADMPRPNLHAPPANEWLIFLSKAILRKYFLETVGKHFVSGDEND